MLKCTVRFGAATWLTLKITWCIFLQLHVSVGTRKSTASTQSPLLTCQFTWSCFFNMTKRTCSSLHTGLKIEEIAVISRLRHLVWQVSSSTVAVGIFTLASISQLIKWKMPSFVNIFFQAQTVTTLTTENFDALVHSYILSYTHSFTHSFIHIFIHTFSHTNKIMKYLSKENQIQIYFQLNKVPYDGMINMFPAA